MKKGFHKILKKHDRRLPEQPCKLFYVNRLNSQSWLKGDCSDVMVTMSRIYSVLRGDEVNTPFLLIAHYYIY